MIAASVRKYRTRLTEYNSHTHTYGNHMCFFYRVKNMFRKTEFITSAVSKEQYPNKSGLPEFAFLGRSNVGKSSLINAIAGRKMLAHTSSKPGKTRAVNFYLIDDAFYLVDLPGYGYAGTGIEKRLTYGGYIEEYLKGSLNLRRVFLLIDTKVGATEDDVLMLDFLRHFNIPTFVIATKADKVGKTLLYRHLKAIREKLKLGEGGILPTSAETQYGIEELRNLLN